MSSKEEEFLEKTGGDLSDIALDMIISKSGSLLQSDLRRLLGVESSKCSRIVIKLEREGLIRRERFSSGGSRTYLLRASGSERLKRPTIHRLIDTYLTEVYLLYLIRGARAPRPGE